MYAEIFTDVLARGKSVLECDGVQPDENNFRCEARIEHEDKVTVTIRNPRSDLHPMVSLVERPLILGGKTVRVYDSTDLTRFTEPEKQKLRDLGILTDQGKLKLRNFQIGGSVISQREVPLRGGGTRLITVFPLGRLNLITKTTLQEELTAPASEKCDDGTKLGGLYYNPIVIHGQTIGSRQCISLGGSITETHYIPQADVKLDRINISASGVTYTGPYNNLGQLTTNGEGRATDKEGAFVTTTGPVHFTTICLSSNVNDYGGYISGKIIGEYYNGGVISFFPRDFQQPNSPQVLCLYNPNAWDVLDADAKKNVFEWPRSQPAPAAVPGMNAQQADNDVPPEVNITSAAGGSEGDDVTFVITATPAPTAALPVSVTVTAAGDYGISTGVRTVSIPTGGSFTLTLSTTDDTVDEADGSVTLTLGTGAGYTVGSLSSQTASITDDDVATQQQVDNEDTNPYAAYAGLIAAVRVYVAETANGEEHVKRWQRVLKALGEKDAAFADLSPMTASEAQTYADRGWSRWEPVVTALTALEAAAQPPVQPTVSIAGGSAVTEGGDVTFTLTADPAPAANLAVTVSVSESGNVASSGATGTRTVTIGTGGTVDFTVATEDDATDEADGSIAATVTAGTGYTVGSVATASVAVADNDVPTISIAGGSAVTEGGDVTFTLTADPVPAANLAVTVSVSENGNFAASGQTGARTVTIGTGGTVTFTVATEDDDVDEADGSIAATVTAGTGYTVGSTATASVAVADNDVPPPEVNITSAAGGSEGADVTFVITATPAPTAALPVSVTITAVGEYGISAGARTVSIPTGGSFTLRLSTTDDTVDEDDGSVTLTLGTGAGYTVGSLSSQTASITDDDVATQQQQVDEDNGEDDNPYGAYADLIATVRGYAGETESGEEHVKRWQRVLKGLGESDAAFANLTPMAASEAQTYADKGWARWEPVAMALTALEAATQLPVQPTVSITGGSAVTEGGDVTFTLTATPPPAADLAVTVSVSETGSFTSAGATGARTVTIGAGGTVDFTVTTEDDEVDETDGVIEAMVTAGTGYAVAAAPGNGASVAVADNDVPVSTKPLLSVSDASGEEGEALEFVIRLSSPLEKWMTVVVRTRESSPVSARYGQDFRLRCPDATSVCSDVGNDPENYIVMNFRPGETEKTVSVSALDDAHDDDGETFEVYIDTVYFVEVEIADGVGVGTIRNSDPIPAAWLGRFGRTVSQQVVDAVTGRFKAAPDVPNGGLDLTVAGEHLSSMPLEENEGALRKLLGFESVSGEQLVAASSFNFSPQSVAAGDGGRAGGAGQLSVWGQGVISSFSGREDDLSLAGDVTTALLGAEWSRGRWQAGAALSHSWGSGGYAGAGDAADGSISTTLLGLFPYGRYALTSRLDLWAIGGYGWGNLTLKPQRDGAGELNTDTNLVMGAVGLEGVVLDGGAAGLSLTTTADALVVETTSAEVTGLKGSEATVSRLRLGLEATRPIPLDGGASLLPSLEVGIRQDGGDAETGYGVEVGAGVVWKDPQRGIRGEVQGRTLVTHTEEEFREQGLALSFAWEPSPDKRGPSLSMGHTMGASASGGMDALLQPVVLEGLAAPGGHGQQFEAEFAYGFPAFNDRLTLTPGVTLAFSPDSRSYGLLWSLAPYSVQGQEEPWEITLEGERQEYRSAASPAEHSLKLRFSLLF